MYIDEVKKGLTEKGGNGPQVLKETVATAWVDGNNIPGLQTEGSALWSRGKTHQGGGKGELTFLPRSFD